MLDGVARGREKVHRPVYPDQEVEYPGGIRSAQGMRRPSAGRNRLIPGFLGEGVGRAEDILNAAVAGLQHDLQCEAVGIRLVDDDGNLTYRAHTGFPSGYCHHINQNCRHLDTCVCVQVLRGTLRLNPLYSTGRGTLTIGTAVDEAALAETADTVMPHLYGNAHEFHSIAITPLELMNHNLGIIHCADSRPAFFDRESADILETRAADLSRRLFYDSLWRPAPWVGEPVAMTQAHAVCPICSRRRERPDHWVKPASPPKVRTWSVLGAPRVVCPTCLRICGPA